jgi:hypothetical protein
VNAVPVLAKSHRARTALTPFAAMTLIALGLRTLIGVGEDLDLSSIALSSLSPIFDFHAERNTDPLH